MSLMFPGRGGARPITRVSGRVNERAAASANLPESMSSAGESRYQPSGADDNTVLHNNVPTSAGGAGATRTSRRADKGR